MKKQRFILAIASIAAVLIITAIVVIVVMNRGKLNAPEPKTVSEADAAAPVHLLLVAQEGYFGSGENKSPSAELIVSAGDDYSEAYSVKPRRDGYIFDGWKDEKGTPITEKDIIPGGEEIVLYPRWQANDNIPYSIKVLLEDENGYQEDAGLSAEMFGTTDMLIKLSEIAPDCDGYVLAGGAVSDAVVDGKLNDSVLLDEVRLTGTKGTDIYLYYTRKLYTVVVNGDDGIASTNINKTEYYSGENVIVSCKLNDGYEFVEWLSEQGVGSDDRRLSFVMPASDVTVTAVTMEVAKEEVPEESEETNQDANAVVAEPVATPTVAPTATPLPTPTVRVTATPTPTVRVTTTPTPTIRVTATPTPTKKATPTPTKKVTPTPTKKPTPTPIKKVTPTPTKKATPTPTKKATPTPTKKATPTPTKKATPTPTKKATPTPTKKVTPTPTKKATPTPTNTPAPTRAVATPTPDLREQLVTYNVTHVSKNGTPLGTSTVTKVFGYVHDVYPDKEYEGYKLPSMKRINWDSAEKTIVFEYEPAAPEKQVKTGSLATKSSVSQGLTYSATLQYRNRTADSVEVSVKWTTTLKGLTGNSRGQAFRVSSGSVNSGDVIISKYSETSEWANSNRYDATSLSKTSPWIKISGLDVDTHEVTIRVYYYQIGKDGNDEYGLTGMAAGLDEKWTMEIPRY